MKWLGPLPALVRRVSLPVRGAWVEIAMYAVIASFWSSRSPCGERGLKYLLDEHFNNKLCRSPCGERGLK